MSSSVLARNANSKIPVLTEGHGAYVVDSDGKRYLDAMGGVAVNVIGHGVEEIFDSLAQMKDKAFYAYAQEFSNPWQEEFADRLLQVTGRTGSVYFSSGGSEANEVSVKFARQYHAERGEYRRWKIISRSQAYHGNTLGMLSVSGRPTWRSPYDPYLFHSPVLSALNTYRPGSALMGESDQAICEQWVEEFERLVWYEDPETISAFLFEPISGASIAGAEPPHGYYEAISDICRKHGILTIADEVFVGYGRTGEVLAGDHFSIKSDIVTLGKGLGSGYAALGASLLSEPVSDTIRRGTGKHTQGYTFSGLPIGCFIAVQVLNYIERHDLFTRSRKIGEYMHDTLRVKLSGLEMVGDLRGRGLLAGIELVQNAGDNQTFSPEDSVSARVAAKCRSAGVIIFPGAPDVAQHLGGDQVHITPPFVVSESDIDFMTDVLASAIEKVGNENDAKNS